MTKNKKADLELTTVGKIILAVIILIILILIAYMMKDKIIDLIIKAGKLLRFGV